MRVVDYGRVLGRALDGSDDEDVKSVLAIVGMDRPEPGAVAVYAEVRQLRAENASLRGRVDRIEQQLRELSAAVEALQNR